MKKLFVADIDGTLLNSKGILEEETVKAIKRYQAKGGIFMLATGRNSFELAEITSRIDQLIINCVNGALLCEEDGTTIFSDQISITAVLKALELAHNSFSPIEFHGNDKTYIINDKEFFKNRALEHFAKHHSPSEAERIYRHIYENDYTIFSADINKIIKAGVNKIEILFCKDEIYEKLIMSCKRELEGVNISALKEMANIEITSDKADKGTAIKRFCDQRNISYDDVVVIGDSDNDIAMLKMFSDSYAVANASDNTKKAASYVTVSNNDLAVAKLLDRICSED
ncbi:MAG: HAD family hydrolase [Erysipelotrichaceae bacterium]|nr:HAD family hydrolase [Erysipelotrichaceae bacterium]